MPDAESRDRNEREPKDSRLPDTYFRKTFPAFAQAVKGSEKDGRGPLAETVERNIRKQEDKYEDVYKRHAKKYGTSIDEYKRRLQKKVEEIVAESEFFQRITVDALKDVVGGSGWIKSQVETGTAGPGSYHGPGVKRSADEALFGYPMDGDASKRPVFGYISRDPNGQVHGSDMSGYGPVMVKYKRSRIINRTTVTFGDSYNGAGMMTGSSSSFVPTPASHPHFTSAFPGSFSKPERGENIKDWDPLTDLTPSDRPARRGASGEPYYEAQYHGGVGIADVESIHVKQSDLDSNPTLKNIIDSLSKGSSRGIKVVIY